MNGSLLTFTFIAAVVISELGPAKPSVPLESRAITGGLPLSPDEQSVLMSAENEFAAGRYTECLKILEQAMSTSSQPHPELLNLRGATLVELGRLEEAAGILKWAIQAQPTHFWAQFNLAEISLLQGDLPGARKGFSDITSDLAIERELIALKLLLIELRLDDVASARRRLLPWPPASGAGYAAYAALARHEGDTVRARELIQEARRVYPDQWGVFLEKTLQESGIKLD